VLEQVQYVSLHLMRCNWIKGWRKCRKPEHSECRVNGVGFICRLWGQ